MGEGEGAKWKENADATKGQLKQKSDLGISHLKMQVNI